MQRQKTAEEFEQERRDEEFARQLQEQLDAEEQRQHPPPQQVSPRPAGPTSRPGYPAAGEVQHLVCPACQVVNAVSLRPGQRAQCGTCGTVFAPPNSANLSPSRTPSAGPHRSSRVTCQNCRSINEIPINTSTTKFMCGHCYRMLTFNQSPSTLQQPHPQQQQHQQMHAPPPPGAMNLPASTAPAAGAGEHEAPAGPVYQGAVVKRIQVRCGECDTVNQVRANPKETVVKFACSNCQQENEVELGQ